jgi:pyridinium-3,5-biscarboxylic acid mononucleotide sulfurtransferase
VKTEFMPTEENSENLKKAPGEKESLLKEILKEMGSLVIGFSGGVDSTYLAVVANQVLGKKALVVTADSYSIPRAELEFANELAGKHGFNHRVINTDEMSNPNYAANPEDRCYYCKQTLYTDLARIAKDEGYSCVVDGFNWDDLKDYRPGSQAGAELKIRSPLKDAYMTKDDIRKCSSALGLPTHDKPASACLASRFPYGLAITPEGLRMVEESESFLHKLGFRHVRVRHHDNIARIEVPAGQIIELAGKSGVICDKLKEIGYKFVAVDLQGYRTGSLNEVLSPGVIRESSGS